MPRFEIYKDKRGEWRWRLRADNHEILATGGEGYVKRASCLRGIELVKTLSMEADEKEVDNT